ncbi:MAG: hypothetical protein ACLP8A_13525 [Methylovirgula sp.]
MQSDPIIPEGWSLQSVERHYDVVYWGMWALHFLSSLMPGVNPTPPVADVSYRLRRNADGKVETVRLEGNHAPDALAKTIELLKATPASQ